MSTTTEANATIFYSARDCGFVFLAERDAYDAAGTWPDDALEVTDEEWQEFGQQPPPPGMRRGSDDKGRPAWVQPVVTPEEASEQERMWRNRQLSLTDPLITRHRDQAEVGRVTTLSPEQYRQLQDYRMELRDWPDSAMFPDIAFRPSDPVWLVNQSSA